jgi:hypothetical protein
MHPIQAAVSPFRLAAILALSLVLAFVEVAADDAASATPPLEVGQQLPALQLSDQHERPGPVGGDIRLVLFAPDREGGEVAHEVLETIGAETLARSGIVYIADISAMPGLVTRMFALPKMRDYSYPLLLGREPADTAMMPRRAGALTLIGLDAGSITAVSYAATADALRAALRPYLGP